MNVALENERVYKNKIHPYKFALWLGCGSIIMMFAAWTSAYVVRHAAGNWYEFKLPVIFYYNTAVILLSSITLQGCYISFKKSNEYLYKSLLIATFLLGIAFIVLQYQGWFALKNSGVALTRNPSGDFVYVLSGVHALHVLGGLAVLTVALVQAFVLRFRVTAVRKLRLELTLTYWHFVDILWIYLLFFFVLQ